MEKLKILKTTLLTGAFLAAGSSAGASVLAYNFAAGNNNAATATAESGIQAADNTDALNAVAGLYEAPSWTNLLVSGSTGSTAGTDTSTAVTVRWNAGGTQNGSSNGVTSGADASQQVFYQSLTDQDGGQNPYQSSDDYGATIQLSGLSGLMSSTGQTTYSLVIFLASSTSSPEMGIPQIKFGNLAVDGSTAIASMTGLGAFTIITLGDGTQPIPGFSSSSSDDNGIRGLATISGLTANQVTIAMPATEAGSQRSSIAGFAIVTGPNPVPEPCAFSLAVVAALTQMRRRRR